MGLVSLAGVLGSLVTAVTIAPEGLSTGQFLYGSARVGEQARYSVRMLGDYQYGSGGSSSEDLVGTTISGVLGFSDTLLLQGLVQGAAALERTDSGISNRFTLRAGYAPQLTQDAFKFGALLGASFLTNGSNVEFRQSGGGAQLVGYGGTMIGAMTLALEARGEVTHVAGETTTTVGPGVMASYDFDPVSVFAEGQMRFNVEEISDQWAAVAALGLSTRIFGTGRLLVAANYTFEPGGNAHPGVLLALSGIIGSEDSDGDGIPDTEDACPGVTGDPQYAGCTFEDDDADGVWDRFDACPGEKGTEANAGCAPRAAE